MRHKMAYSLSRERLYRVCCFIDRYGMLTPAYRAVVSRFLAKRHKVGGSGTRSFSMKAIFGELGVQRLTRFKPRAAHVTGHEVCQKAGCGKSARLFC